MNSPPRCRHPLRTIRLFCCFLCSPPSFFSPSRPSPPNRHHSSLPFLPPFLPLSSLPLPFTICPSHPFIFSMACGRSPPTAPHPTLPSTENLDAEEQEAAADKSWQNRQILRRFSQVLPSRVSRAPDSRRARELAVPSRECARCVAVGLLPSALSSCLPSLLFFILSRSLSLSLPRALWLSPPPPLCTLCVDTVKGGCSDRRSYGCGWAVGAVSTHVCTSSVPARARGCVHWSRRKVSPRTKCNARRVRVRRDQLPGQETRIARASDDNSNSSHGHG